MISNANLKMNRLARIYKLLQIFYKAVETNGCQKFDGMAIIPDDFEMTLTRGDLNEIYRFLFEEFEDVSADLCEILKNQE